MWTLDYPPLFAYFELFLSQIAYYFDKNMLKVYLTNLKQIFEKSYRSMTTIIFQRISVILSEVVLLISIFLFKSKSNHLSYLIFYFSQNSVIYYIFLFNPCLLLVDNIHFQYNGMLIGLLLISIYFISRGQDYFGAIFFIILFNFKHLFILLAPVYGIYLLKHYCIDRSSIINFLVMGFTVIVCNLCSISLAMLFLYYPFISSFTDLQQIFSRLFPFQRGLVHTYWAPNFWSLYITIDKIACKILKIETV